MILSTFPLPPSPDPLSTTHPPFSYPLTYFQTPIHKASDASSLYNMEETHPHSHPSTKPYTHPLPLFLLVFIWTTSDPFTICIETPRPGEAPLSRIYCQSYLSVGGFWLRLLHHGAYIKHNQFPFIFSAVEKVLQTRIYLTIIETGFVVPWATLVAIKFKNNLSKQHIFQRHAWNKGKCADELNERSKPWFSQSGQFHKWGSMYRVTSEDGIYKSNVASLI